MDKQNRFFLSVTLSLFLGLVALRAITQRKPSSQMMEAMVAMACMIVAAILFYHVFTSRFFVREKATRSEPKQLSKFRYCALLLSVAAVFVAAGAGRFVVEYYNVEALFGSGEALWRKTHPLVLLLIGICCFLYAFYTILNEPEESDDRIKEKIHPITLLCYCMAVFLYAVALYAPNVRNNDTWHMTAALQSIYNVAFNTPFTMRTSGIYGHYAIFFWPFVKLFGHRPVAIAVMISVCGAVCEILFLYTLHQMIRSECIRRLAAFASIMPLMLLYRYAYFQVYPLRILPPMVVLAYAAWCERKKTEVGENKQLLVGYILCALGIVWVTDVGLIATVAFSAWVLFGSLRQEGRFNRRVFRTCAYCLLGCVLAVAGMVLIINFYNVVICRAAPVLRACFFPFVGASGFSTGLQLNLVWKNISWIWVMVLFVVCTLIGLTATPLLKDVFHADAKWDMLFLCAVMGIGQSCYYFNRAAYFNLTIIAQEAVLCMAFLIERGRGIYRKKAAKTCGRAIALGVCLSILCEFSLLAGPTFMLGMQSFQQKRELNIYSTASLKELAQQVEESGVPQDTYAVGLLTQEVYAELGWNPQYLQRDVSDFFGEGIEEIEEEIRTQDSLLLQTDMCYLLEDEDGWSEGIPVPADNPVFYYYTRESLN